MRVLSTFVCLFALALGVCLCAPAQAATSSHDPKAVHMTEGSMLMPDGTSDMKAMRHGDMMENMVGGCMMKTMSARAMLADKNFTDRAYLSAMIAHHEAAVDMADAELKSGKDPVVLQWAKDVKAAQGPEIKQMQEWLAGMGGVDEAAAGMMRQHMHAMMANPAGTDADYNFVSMMIGHHAGAVDMAAQAIVASNNDQVVALSQDIITVQIKEIIAYKGWLAKRAKQ